MKRKLRVITIADVEVDDDRMLSPAVAGAMRSYYSVPEIVQGSMPNNHRWIHAHLSGNLKTVVTITHVFEDRIYIDGWPMWLLDKLPYWLRKLLIPRFYAAPLNVTITDDTN